MQAAQASNNVPARYDPVRLRRPTTPLTGHGCPIGLGVHLSVTTAEPATEMSSVAAVAPARVVTTPPTYLHHSLRRLADGSRPPTPEGSRPACAGGDVATPIRPITGRPSLPPSFLYPLLCQVILRLPLLSEDSRATGLPRSAGRTSGWCRSRLFAGGTPSASEEFGASELDHVPFGPSLILKPP